MAKTKALLKKQNNFQLAVMAVLALGAVYLGYKIFFSHAATAPSWHSLTHAGLPSGYTPIDVGVNTNHAYIVEHKSGTSSGYVYLWTGSGWTRLGNDIHADRVAADQGDSPWATSNGGYIYRWSDTAHNWVSYSAGKSGFEDVAISPTGAIYAKTLKTIYKWNGSGWSVVWGSPPKGESYFGPIAAGMYEIFFTTQPSNHVYDDFSPILNSSNEIQSRGYDVGVYNDSASTGGLWLIASDNVTGGHSVYLCDWECHKWTGAGIAISADRNNNPWLVNNTGNIYRWY